MGKPHWTTSLKASEGKPSAYRNVDLEIESRARLDLLAAELGERVHVLHCGPGRIREHLLSLEIWGKKRGPDETIHSFCDLIESLSSSSRRLWDRALKAFDVGYDLRPSERYSRFGLRPDTLQRMANLGASLVVTYYRGDDED